VLLSGQAAPATAKQRRELIKMTRSSTEVFTSASAELITIRRADRADALALRRLAERDSTSLEAEPYLLAEVGGTPRAALGLQRGAVIADPFRPTAHLVTMLELAGR
jgi:hypothetical protein